MWLVRLYFAALLVVSSTSENSEFTYGYLSRPPTGNILIPARVFTPCVACTPSLLSINKLVLVLIPMMKARSVNIPSSAADKVIRIKMYYIRWIVHYVLHNRYVVTPLFGCQLIILILVIFSCVYADYVI